MLMQLMLLHGFTILNGQGDGGGSGHAYEGFCCGWSSGAGSGHSYTYPGNGIMC